MGTAIGLLVMLVIFLIGCAVAVGILWGVKWVLGYMELPPDWHRVILVIVGLICLIFLLIILVSAWPDVSTRHWI